MVLSWLVLYFASHDDLPGNVRLSDIALEQHERETQARSDTMGG